MTTNPRVDAYIAQAAPFAQPILRHLRALVHRGCPDVTEQIKWGMPSFDFAGRILCHFAAFKAHGAFGFWHREMERILAADGVDGDGAMGSFGRLTCLDDLPSDRAILRYVKIAAKLNANGTPNRRTASKPRPEYQVPRDLAAALQKNPRAAATFAKFAPSHRRDYIEWIVDAKRAETRAKRLATTLAWLAEGKSRNWKYANG